MIRPSGHLSTFHLHKQERFLQRKGKRLQPNF